MSTEFNPTQYLTDLKGKAYLEVRYRVMWFRHDHPEGTIRTKPIEITDQRAVFQAEASFPVADDVHATGFGTGSETPRDFGDYIEKAETKAIGRALAALGYGTQFAVEIDEMDGNHGPRIVDSPVQTQRQAPPPQQYQQQAPRQQNYAPQGSDDNVNPLGPSYITPRQIGFLWRCASENGWTKEDVHTYLDINFGTEHANELKKDDAKVAIDHIKATRK